MYKNSCLVMRRRFVGDVGRMSLGRLQAVAQSGKLTRQRIDLLPLLGDGLVQRFDDLVLEHQPGLERVDTVAQRFGVTHRNAFSLPVPASRGRARRGRQTQSIRRASGSRLAARLPDI